MRKKLLILTTSLFVVLIISIALILLTGKVSERSTFNADRWDTNVDERTYMKEDLTENYLVGLSYEETINLLGTKAINLRTTNKLLEYVIGVDSRLVLYFNEGGIYEKFEIIP